jgi:hypothetical protein
VKLSRLLSSSRALAARSIKGTDLWLQSDYDKCLRA